MNTRIAEHIQKVTASTTALTAFGEKFDIPDGIGWPDIQEDGARFSITLTSRSASDRARALQFAGDIFGRDGWTAKPNHSRDGFDWTKIVDGVAVKIYDAETMPPAPESIPVPPSKFPIQLAEVASE